MAKEEIWRIDSQYLDDDEFLILWHTAEEELELAEMYKAEPRPELSLASGPGWAISVWERGDGICSRASAGATGSESCNLSSMWQIPDILDISVGIAYNDDRNPVSGEMTGLVAQDITRIVVTFESGDTIDLTLGTTIQLGVRGFGVSSFDAAQLGEPTTNRSVRRRTESWHVLRLNRNLDSLRDAASTTRARGPVLHPALPTRAGRADLRGFLT